MHHTDESEFIEKILKLTTTETDNPDLRDRGFIYWRLLAGDLDFAKSIVFGERPPISEDSGNLEPDLLESLLENLSMLSSIYYKKPEHFVPKIKQKANERFDLEHVENEELQVEVNEPPPSKKEEAPGIHKYYFII